MKNISLLSLALLATVSISTACMDAESDDELASDEGEIADDGLGADKADDPGTSNYYSIEAIQAAGSIGSNPPIRYQVRRANASKTRCADGVSRSACSVATLDFSQIRFAETQERGLRGAVSQKINSGEAVLMLRGKFAADSFKATEAWLQRAEGMPADGSLPGVAVRVKDSGIRCIVAPCPSLREEKLNSTASINLHGIKTPSEELTSLAYDAAFGGKGIILVGYRKTINRERTRDASAVFERIGE